MLVAVFVGIIFLTTRPHPLPTAPPLEVQRQNLELRAGRWYAPGQTNGFTGFLLDTYDDGAKKSRSEISNGLLNGLSAGWHTNDQQQVAEHYVAGVSEGLRTKWHPNGRKLSEVTIVNGKLQGIYRSWHDNGKLAEEVELKDGQPQGRSKAYFPSGFTKARVVLREGKPVEQQFWQDGESKAGLARATPPASP